MKFEAFGRVFEYADHAYNATRFNERAVELPIAASWMRAAMAPWRGTVVTEIGNVSRHYPIPHAGRVVDLYEDAPNTIREDVRTWAPAERPHAILAISTFEHVGFDDGTDPRAAPLALQRVADEVLAEGGSMLVTIPLGQNPVMDRAILEGETGETVATALHRDEVRDPWIEANVREARPYIGNGYGARSVWIAQYGKRLL